MNKLNGYKTYIGGAFIALGAFLKAIGNPELGDPLITLGEAVSVVGLGHKLAKVKK